MKPGTRLHSSVSEVSVVVVRPGGDGDIICAGAAMGTEAADNPATASEGEPVHMGKRYHDATSGLEVLCVKGGVGPLVFDGRQLEVKSAKQLPASD